MSKKKVLKLNNKILKHGAVEAARDCLEMQCDIDVPGSDDLMRIVGGFGVAYNINEFWLNMHRSGTAERNNFSSKQGYAP